MTTNFLCFYANIFRWETAVTIRWREVRHESELASNYFSMCPLQVTEMKKEKTALVIPNAVQVKIVDLLRLLRLQLIYQSL